MLGAVADEYTGQESWAKGPNLALRCQQDLLAKLTS